jgi:hypothetical protein
MAISATDAGLKPLLAAKERAHLPRGLACRVLYQGAVVDIPGPRDPFEVMAAAWKRLGNVPLERDAKFEAVMARRAAEKQAA